MDFKDPKITKYLLDEMSLQEKRNFESELKNNEDLLKIVSDFKIMSESLNQKMKAEHLALAHVEKDVSAISKFKNFFIIFLPVAVVASFAFIIVLPEQQKDEFDHATVPPPITDSVVDKVPEEKVSTNKVIKKKTGVEKRGGLINVGGIKTQAYGGRGKISRVFSKGRGVYTPFVMSEQSQESYDSFTSNNFFEVLKEPLSTFSVDVDTASYSNVRRVINRGGSPVKDSVRVEEMINYFNYPSYSKPSGKIPFSVNTELVNKTLWNKKHKLLRIGLKGKSITWSKRRPSNLVFLVDVSGSMSDPNKLPLVKQGFKLMVESLGANDRVALVVYAGASGLVLPSTKGSDKEEILAAFERINSGGSTNGGAGIELAYKVANDNYIKGGINRVILATDGDFNVGTTSRDSLVSLIKKKAESNIFLTVLGFGTGNLKDSQMEALANKGNGSYAYIDSYKEAKKVLVDQIGGSLITIAKDVKIQVEFNPNKVLAYRLVGYENRKLNKEDFNDDKKDAGEIGSGHTVTALYEIIPVGLKVPSPLVDKLKYQKVISKPVAVSPKASESDEWLTVKLRYKEPEGEKSSKLEVVVKDEVSMPSLDTRWAQAVAGFGMILRDSRFKDDLTIDKVILEAKACLGPDQKKYRSDFIELLKKYKKSLVKLKH